MHEDVECMLLGAVQGNCWDVGLGGNGGMQKKGGGVKTTIKTERAVGAGLGTAQMWINQSISQSHLSGESRMLYHCRAQRKRKTCVPN